MRGDVASPGFDRSRLPVWAVAWLVCLFALTITIRVFDPTGWVGSDDASYYSAAEHVLTGQPIQRLHHHYARAAIVLPVAASVAIFGHNAEAVALPMLAASVLCVMLVVLMGRTLFGWWEGLFAGTVVAVLPYFRILSTTAFPDVHVCLWTTAAMLLAVQARRRLSAMLWLSCGFALGLAVSAKVFAIAVAPAIALIGWRGSTPPTRGGATFRSAALVLIGLASFQLLEGLFYLWAAGDFFFSLHATLAVQASVPGMTTDSVATAMTPAQFVVDRLMMLMRPSTSGWGWIGVLFWPTLLAAGIVKKSARPLVVWAMSTFVLVAFVPLNFSSGAQPYPIFHGRHILPACIPFALCLAWIARSVLERAIAAPWSLRAWPIAAACVVVVALGDIRSLNGFRDRATRRVGDAIRELVANPSWDDSGEIFMTPSTYWRFRVLFPDSVRSRLRVATAESSPDWWKKACPDIVQRWAPLPPPGKGYLIATPAQLLGPGDQRDYGVGLPPEYLIEWQRTPALTTLVRSPDKRISRSQDGSPHSDAILVLVGPAESQPRLAGTP